MDSKAAELITETIQNYFASETQAPSLKRFVEENRAFVLQNSHSADLQRVWAKAFKSVAHQNGQTFNSEEPEWGPLITEKLDIMLKEAKKNVRSTKKSTRTRSVSSSSPAQSATTDLSPDQWQSFEDQYNTMVTEKKWEIEPGVFVEDKIYEYARTCDTENAAHSFILDTEADWLPRYFTESQIRTLKMYRCSPLPPIAQSAADFFDKLTGKDDLESLSKAVREAGDYDEVTEFDADWAQISLRDLIRSYRWGIIQTIANRNSETDIILRIWRMIDTVFDNTGLEASRGDKVSVAMSARLNNKRKISSNGLTTKATAWKPDLLLTKNEVEFGCSENGGKDEGGVGTKEIVEKWLKMPKILKDMFNLASEKANWDEALIRDIRIIGFMHTHLRISLLIMDCPAGYVCRISRTTEREVPLQVRRVAFQIVPIMKLILKAKAIVTQTIEILDRGTQDEPEEPDLLTYENHSKRLTLPHAMNPPASPNKKIKVSTSTTA